MNYAVMSYTVARGDWGKDHDVVALCRLANELELDGIDWVTTYNTPADVVRRVMDDHGLKTVCHTFFADINFPDRASRRQGLDNIKKGIETASILGTDRVMLPFKGKEAFSRDESRRNVIEGIKDVIEFAKAAKVALSVEHFPGATAPFVVSDDMNAALREVPDLRVTFDSGNVLTGGENPSAGFLNNRSAIVHVHFKDYVNALSEDDGLLGLDGTVYNCALIGEGLVDYPELIRTMTESGYSGYIDIEYEGTKYSPEDAMRKALKNLRSIERSLEIKP